MKILALVGLFFNHGFPEHEMPGETLRGALGEFVIEVVTTTKKGVNQIDGTAIQI